MKIVLVLLLIVAVIASPFVWNMFICGIHEKDYGVNTKWTLLSGCMIETKAGEFVPEARFRGVSD